MTAFGLDSPTPHMLGGGVLGCWTKAGTGAPSGSNRKPSYNSAPGGKSARGAAACARPSRWSGAATTPPSTPNAMM
ncbi:MAG: hypothetical protein NZM11_10930, partial [Anaerolineales bacterium]|nr:hypothetical protein [Anaerolineales bacterium]